MAVLVLASSGGVRGLAGAPQANDDGAAESSAEESEYVLLWRRLDRLSRRGDWQAVIEGLARAHDLVERPEINPVVSSGAGLSVGIRRLLADVAERLPAQERRPYLDRLDAALSEFWAGARSSGDEREIARVRRRILSDHPLSRLREELLQEEVTASFEQGSWEAARSAARQLIRLLDEPASREDSDAHAERMFTVRVRAGAALLRIAALLGERKSLAQESERLTALLSSAAGQQLGETFRKRVEQTIEAAPRLLESVQLRQRVRPPDSLHPRVVATTPADDEQARAFAVGSPRWQLALPAGPVRPMISEMGRDAEDGDLPLPYHATADGELIAFQHSGRVVALGQADLSEHWSHSLPADAIAFSGVRVPVLTGDACLVVSDQALIAFPRERGPRLWSAVFYYDEAAKQLKTGDRRRRDKTAADGAKAPGGDGAPSGEEADRAPPVCLLGPPAPTPNGVVLPVTVRVARESLVYIVGVSRKGTIDWSTYIGSTSSSNYLGQGGAASPPLVAGGRAYLQSNQGLLAAIDADDGTIEWVLEYPALDEAGQERAIRATARWQVNPILLADDTIIAAPRDSAWLLAIDAQNGALIWRRPREQSSVLAGLTETACILTGRSIAAVSRSGPARGSIIWRRTLPRDEFSPLGRAVLTPHGLLVPGRRNLLVLSPSDGRVLSRTLWDVGGGGNLLLAGAWLGVTAPESLVVYDSRSAERKRLEQAGGRDSPDNRLRWAKYHLRGYDVSGGLRELALWTDSAPPLPVPNSDIDRLQLDLSELLALLIRRPRSRQVATDGDAADDDALSMLRYRYRLESTPERKVRAAIELADALEAGGDVSGAAQVYHEALASDRGRTEYEAGGFLSLSSNAYIRGRIRALREHAPTGKHSFAIVERDAFAALEDARKKSSPLAFGELVRLWPFTEAAADAYLDLSMGYRDRLSYDQAIEALEHYLEDFEALPGSDESEIVRVQLTLIHLLALGNRRQEAKERSLAVMAKYGDRQASGVVGVARGETVREHLEPRLSDPGVESLPPVAPPRLRAPLRMAWRSAADLEALQRRFVEPKGEPPPSIRDRFITQSSAILECISTATGISVWRINLSRIPSFQLPRSSFLTRLPRTGPRELRGRFVDERIILHDEHNLFAIDTGDGRVRWHLPIGAEEVRDGDPARAITVSPLRERVRRVRISASGVHVITSHRKLYFIDLEGQTQWERDLEYEPAALWQPILAGDRLLVHFTGRGETGLQVHNARTGAPLRKIVCARLTTEPLELGGGRVLLASLGRLELFDVDGEQAVWEYETGRSSSIDTLYRFDDAPEECVVVFSRAGRSPVLAGLSLRSGRELWRYDGLPPRATTVSVFREANRIYVIHGESVWRLLALEVNQGVRRDRRVVATAWAREQKLGTFYSGSTRRRLHIGDGVLIFHDPHDSFSVYDKNQGTTRPAIAEGINGFLVEKDSYDSQLQGGRLVLLADGGNCAFESTPRPEAAGSALTDVGAALQWLASRADSGHLIELAQEYFRRERLQVAIDLLDRALMAEDALAGRSQLEQMRVRKLLDGYRQELMEREFKRGLGGARLTSRQLSTSPIVDGELDDWWDVGSRLRLDSPKFVGTVPGPEALQHWEGEEDLSATIYTGWDDEYFYFALDVTDDVLHPYDRDAEKWKGDCLIIGLDPTDDMGYRQAGSDQLMTLALTIPQRRKEDKSDDEGDDDDDDDEQEDPEEKENKPEGKFAVKRRADNTGAVYEVGLPWASFSAGAAARLPRAGFRFGLSLLLTDDDTGQGATKTLSLNPCQLLPSSQKSALVWRFIIPNYFPQVTLE